MDQDKALRHLVSSDSEEPYPPDIVEHIKEVGVELGSAVYRSWDTLRGIETRYGDLLRARWSKKRSKDRRKILEAAWSDMPQSHRPECFAEAYTSFSSTVGMPPQERVWPYINLEDLDNKTSLVVLITARARSAPRYFALTEHLFMPAGQTKDSHAPLSRMHMDSREKYGAVEEFSDEVEAIDFEDDARGIGLGRGLQILFVQNKILDFLVTCCEEILHDCNLEDLIPPDSDEEAEHTPLAILEQNPRANYADVTANAPFYPRCEFNLDRVVHLISTEAGSAELHVWALRENPGHFSTTYEEINDHDHRHIRDALGRKDAATRSVKIMSSTLNILVAYSHYSLVFWDQMNIQLQIIKALLQDYPDGLVIGSLQPIELRKAMQFFLILLDNAKIMLTLEIEGYTASPELRAHFIRHEDVEERSSLREDSVRAQVCDLLKAIVESKGWSETRFQIDLLETFLRKHDNGWTWISSLVRQSISRLSALAESSLAFELQPWYQKVVWDTPMEQKKDAKYLDGIWDAFKAWITIFYRSGKSGFIPSPALGDPSDSRFDYPITQSKSKKKVIDQLCRAEANLDAFWHSVDFALGKIADIHGQGALQRILDRSGDMRRTQPWSERHEAQAPKPLSSEDLYRPQPLSQAFHDPSTEITGNFDKAAISSKGKEKTRGEPAAEQEPAEPPRDPLPDPPQTFKVNKKGYQVFAQLFHDPDASTAAQGEVKWHDFVNALKNLGFSAEQMYGSQWQFNPSDNMGLERGISFHQPHPGNTFSHQQARHIGARLGRVYRWDARTFELQ